MAPTLDSTSSDREEGEIIDEFEDISDNSIILPLSGKCDQSKDHLPVISLSSVSEDEEFDKQHHHRHPRHHRFHGHHQHRHHHGKMFKKKKMKMKMKRKMHHHKGLCSDSHSSDSNDFMKLDSKLLKAAIRVNDRECLKNSLRSRLYGMTNTNDGPPSDNPDEVKFSDPKIDHEITSDEGDDELIQLRLEALRTAVLNKFQRRKKRKIKEINDDDHDKTENSIKTDNKENNIKSPISNIENISKKPCIEVQENEKIETNNVDNNTPLEDDEDVLRALLLASISKKMTKEPTINIDKITVKPPVPLGNNNPNFNKTNSFIKESNTNLVHKNTMKINNKIQKNNKLIRINNLPIKHTKVKPIIINVNEDSDSEEELKNNTKNDITKLDVIESTVEKFLKEQRAKVEAQESPIKQKSINNSEIFQKSAVKLLPKFKQIEYQKLLQQLKEKKAQKPRVKRNSHKSNGETKQIINNNSKKLIVSKSNEIKLNKSNDDVLNKSLDIAEDARALQKAFKEMQCPTNGRLQMQVQYKVLTPIVKKIDEASADRKKYNKEVKRLLGELTEAKKKLKETHINFKKYVNDLLAKKEEIDKMRSEKQKNREPPVTSTPLKDKNSFQSFNTSTIPEHSDLSSSKTAPKGSNSPSNIIIDEIKFEENEINPGDPNDIDKIYKREAFTIPRYISPLDNVNRANIDDPFSVMCPYDIDGNCRDPDCAFQHYRT